MGLKVREAPFLRDFRNWQMKHQRGGDFIIYSDSRFISLRRPIRVQL